MTQFLPPNLLALFAPRDPIPYLPPPDKLPHEKKNVHNYMGIAQDVIGNFEDPEETPAPTKVETREERLARKKRDKEEQVAYKLEQEIALWDPTANDASTQDPFKTLFVARINYDTSESKLRREFDTYGPIKSIRLIHDQKTGKPRGYCFIEFEHEKDMHCAYKHADGKKLDGRRVLVDVERARTVRGWLPRRLGGGMGGTRRGGPDQNIRHSGREDGPGRDDRRRSRSRDRGGAADRDRRRRRSRSRSRDRTRRRRSRSREREAGSRRRSRSRDRARKRRSRSRSRDRKERRERRREEKGGAGPEAGGANEWSNVQVKEEPMDNDGPSNQNNDFGNNGFPAVKVKQEKRDDDEEEPVDRKPQIVDNGYYNEAGY